ncbi:MAG: AmmeMemoRadiSam system radical SAM enzyme [Spirochaetes bacterium]|nr:AmmeMemoRadiSam system radical SAM enzyme [Spirochaetota bacterium]
MNKPKEAKYYEGLPDDRVKCLLCPHNCVIQNNKTGICGVRKNLDGKLFSLIYGEATALSMDPIEKKPLYHFYPNSDILSIGTKGCNFKCAYCQNWHISQDTNARSSYYEPDEIISTAVKKNSIGVAYTYSEPFIWFEYVLDCCKIARKNGLKNVFVTNGFIEKEPLNELLEFTDAMNIDLKAFKEATYKKVQKGELPNVMKTIQIACKRCHVELTTLIVTGINDDLSELGEMADWISSVDKNIPWHISRYYPNYKYNAPATDIDFMIKVHGMGRKKLNHVFCGNIPGSYGMSDTNCPSCGTTVIERSGYSVSVKAIKNGKCAKCGFDLKIASD